MGPRAGLQVLGKKSFLSGIRTLDRPFAVPTLLNRLRINSISVSIKWRYDIHINLLLSITVSVARCFWTSCLPRLNNLLSVVGLMLSLRLTRVSRWAYLAKIRHLLVPQLPLLYQSVTAPHWTCTCLQSPAVPHFQYTCYVDLESHCDTRQ